MKKIIDTLTICCAIYWISGLPIAPSILLVFAICTMLLACLSALLLVLAWENERRIHEL